MTAKVTEKNFQVNVTGGTGSGSFVQGKSVTISAASKTGYTFASWSGAAADTGILGSATSASTTLTIPSRDVAYEATYTPNTYTVKFNANGGSGTGVNKKCKVRIAAHTAILKFDRRVALRSAMPAAFLCRQCIPASLHRAATSVLQADSIMPDPM